MSWQIRHEGSPKVVAGLSLQQIVDGLRDGIWEPTDEVKGPSDSTWRHIEDHPQLAEVVLDMEPAGSHTHGEETHLDMNALIDVCMVLLIFFIITTTYATAVQRIIPLADAPIDSKKGTRKFSTTQVKENMVFVSALGQTGKTPIIYIEKDEVKVADPTGTKIDVDKLSNALRPYLRSGIMKTEMVLDAQGISWGEAIAIQDAAKAAGVQKIHRLKQPSGNE